jgi:hypothetical protein
MTRAYAFVMCLLLAFIRNCQITAQLFSNAFRKDGLELVNEPRLHATRDQFFHAGGAIVIINYYLLILLRFTDTHLSRNGGRISYPLNPVR